jgi:hypothetical protein
MWKLLPALLMLATSALAGDGTVSLVIRGHVFIPSEVTIPARTKIAMTIENQDATDEEFESYDLNREQVISPKTKATVLIGPLPPGRYPFFGEFHDKTAHGVLIAQ